MEFKPAVRHSSKARIAISGPSGSGKTWGALTVAGGLGGRVAVIDTENGSASLYAGLPGIPAFDVLELKAPYSPERFIDAMKASAAAGYDITIVDGITPEWNGIGGCLEINESLAISKFRGNTWSAWNETTPRHRKFIDAMISHPAHLIVTMRSKTETSQEEKNGKKVVVKLGMKTEQRDGIEYEFTAVLDLSHNGHYASASKDRSRLWSGHDPAPLTAEDGKRLRAWLESGVEKAVELPTIEQMLDAIANAPDLTTLKNHFMASVAVVRERRDEAGYERVVATKDERKAELDARNAADNAGDPPPNDAVDYVDGVPA